MCGICGFVGDGDTDTLLSMLAAMAYRGPDDSGIWHDGKDLYLGHRRLSILDVASGHQPMLTEDELLVVTFNGEIYNHRELRRELEALGWKFRTAHSDTEILLYGYRQWGRSMVDRLNGMWAFALLDRSRNLLWLSRDRFGKKPLYYAQKGDKFYFASELGSLSCHPAIGLTINQGALAKYFAYGYVPAPTSILQDIAKLAAGHNLIFDLNTRKTQIEQYWRFKFEVDRSWIARPHDLREALVETLHEAVSCRLQADVPVGVFLSGGLDSSSIAALASISNKGEPVRTYSIGFEEKSFDESKYSSRIASLLGTRHTVDTLSVRRCIDLLDTVYKRLDEPMADSSLVPTFLLSHLAKKDVTVALGGDGSDELLAGYDTFKALAPARFYSHFQRERLHKVFTRLVGFIPVSHRNISLDFKLKRFLLGLEYDENIRNAIWLGTLAPKHLSNLFNQSIEPDIIYAETINAWHTPEATNDIERTIQFYIELYLQNNILTKIDRAGMLNALEVRSPFLDINVVNLVRTIPTEMKLRNNQTKSILKTAMAPVLPREVRHRPKKGFGLPIGKWFHDGSLTIDPNALDGLLDTTFVKKLYAEHRDGKNDWRAFLWAHFVFERWLQRLPLSRNS